MVDLAAVVLLFLVAPLAVGAYLVFRAPAPALTSVTPKMLVEGSGQRLEIDGANLRPFMRVTFNATPAASFLLGSTKYALVDVPDLPPGVYDVVLYDYAREVARLPRALTIARVAADAELEIDGAFKSVPDSLVTTLKAGARLPSADDPTAVVLTVGAPSPGKVRLRVGDESLTVPVAQQRDVPATVRVRCSTSAGADGVARCIVPGPAGRTVVAPDALLTFATPAGPLVFQIGAARPAATAGRP